jgi:adenosine/AMP kinase
VSERLFSPRAKRSEVNMEFLSVSIHKPEALNFILGQSHFIKTVEDIHEALVTAVPGIQFGLAFCEASGACLIRSSGTNEALTQLARENAMNIGAGHCFILMLGEGYFPINVLNLVKNIPEVCAIFCATANPTEVVIYDNGYGRGIMGIVEGEKPKGFESPEDVRWRVDFLRRIGYKAG